MRRRFWFLSVAVLATVSSGLLALLAASRADAEKCPYGTNCPASDLDAHGCCSTPPKPVKKPSPRAAPQAPPAPTSWPAPASCPAGMAGIPGNRYTLGETKTEATVQPYCVDVTEVTVSAYQQCVNARQCTEPDGYAKKWGESQQFCNWRNPEGRSSHPVNCVDSDQAEAFCTWRGARLPTEEEWEWAARSGDKGWSYPWGDAAPTEQRANACGAECPPNLERKGLQGWSTLYAGSDGYPETAPVGSFPNGDNRWGVHDLAGNVWEWVAAKPGAKRSERIGRGGGWDDGNAAALGASRRRDFDASDRLNLLGFRCAKSP